MSEGDIYLGGLEGIRTYTYQHSSIDPPSQIKISHLSQFPPGMGQIHGLGEKSFYIQGLDLGALWVGRDGMGGWGRKGKGRTGVS